MRDRFRNQSAESILRAGDGGYKVLPAVARTPPVKLKDVAKAAGVSQTTASSALTGRGRLSDETRDRVKAVAADLGYVANNVAKNLRQRRAGAVGLYLPDQVLGLGYYMEFAFGAVRRGREAGVPVILMGPPTADDDRLRTQADGFVTVDPLAGDDSVRILLQTGAPVVTGEPYLGPGGPVHGTVRSDHREAMFALLDHVRDRGAGFPALIVPGRDSVWAETLRQTFEDWCNGRGLAPVIVDTGDIAHLASPDGITQAVRGLFAEHPAVDTVVTAQDGAALPAIGAAAEFGRRVGHDLLVATCVDSVAMQLSSPSITALDLHPREFGERCMNLLLGILSGEGPDEDVQPIDLVVRASTASGLAR
jgi:DNA-binding LacI/PurR family transcriptional regulator